MTTRLRLATATRRIDFHHAKYILCISLIVAHPHEATQSGSSTGSIMAVNKPTMRAARFYGERDIRIEDIPIPSIGQRQCLVEVEWCGLCGSDMHEYLAGRVQRYKEATVTKFLNMQAQLVYQHGRVHIR